MRWRGLDCKIIRPIDASWIVVMIMTTIPYCVVARRTELG